MGLLEASAELLYLTKIFVPPHVRVSEQGHPYRVSGYWRDADLKPEVISAGTDKIGALKFNSMGDYRQALDIAKVSGAIKDWREEIGESGRTRYLEVTSLDGSVQRYPSQKFPALRAMLGVGSVTPDKPAPEPEPVKEAKVPVPAPVKSSTSVTLKYVGGGSDKFWTASVEGSTVHVRWGKNGTQGQSKDFEFGSQGEALDYFEKKRTEKLVKGYKSSEEGATTKAFAPDQADAPVPEPEPVAVPEPVEVSTPSQPEPAVAPKGGGSHTGVTKSKDELAGIAEKHGIKVDPNWSKVDIMDALREKLGTFDPRMEIDPMKAKDLKERIDWMAPDPFKNIEKEYLNDKWVLEPKLDGARFRLFLGKESNSANTGRRSSVTFAYTERSQNFPHLRDLAIPELAGTILDGELMPPKNSLPTKNGEMTQGSLNSVMSLVSTDPATAKSVQAEHGKAIFVVFDVLAVKGEDVTDRPLTERRKMLEMIMEALHSREPAIQISLQLEASKENIQKALDAGMEGVMLKRKDSKYVPGGRPPTWQKVKKMSTGDFYIIGSVPGKGSNTGKVGSLKVAYRGADGKDVYVADVAGFDEATRTMLTDPETGEVKKEFLGKVLEVMGQGRTKNNRIRHPHFVRWRDDKVAADTDETQINLFSPV